MLDRSFFVDLPYQNFLNLDPPKALDWHRATINPAPSQRDYWDSLVRQYSRVILFRDGGLLNDPIRTIVIIEVEVWRILGIGFYGVDNSLELLVR